MGAIPIALHSQPQCKYYLLALTRVTASPAQKQNCPVVPLHVELMAAH